VQRHEGLVAAGHADPHADAALLVHDLEGLGLHDVFLHERASVAPDRTGLKERPGKTGG
jgi:hypothetical protein